MEAERNPVPEDFELIFPAFMKEIVAELTHLARRSPHISQSSGVSVRMSIANFENLASNSVRRAARLGESLAVPRITDLAFLASSTAGRVEIEALDEGKEEQVLSRLERGAISAVFSRHFSAAQFDGLVARFEDGTMLEVGEGIPARTYTRAIGDAARAGDGAEEAEPAGPPGGAGVGDRVPARGPAPEQAPEQRRGRRPGGLPAVESRIRLPGTALGTSAGTVGDRLTHLFLDCVDPGEADHHRARPAGRSAARP